MLEHIELKLCKTSNNDDKLVLVIGYAAKCTRCGELRISSLLSKPEYGNNLTSPALSSVVPDILIPISIPCGIVKILPK